MTRPQSPGRILRTSLFGALAFTSLSVVGGGCLDRPVAPATPTVSARIVTPAKQNKVSKIDLLFMIDNSSSMADKQNILAKAVPDLVTRLVDPVCINPTTGQVLGNRRTDGSCPQGEPDFDPINDIHIGIITSSLGAHGASGICVDPDPSRTFSHNDDHGHLVARDMMDGVVPTFNNEGFLNWNPNLMKGQVPTDVTTPFQTMVPGVGQHGCGYEASLEAIYRFLIDPEPYQSVQVVGASANSPGQAQLMGTDTVLLKQRADFLRPDSLVAVMMITDENDCSVQDVGQGFYSINPQNLLGHGTTACLTNENDRCCINCGIPDNSVPSGCPPTSTDAECAKGTYSSAEDTANLRCWQQKRRYGADFLYPVQRYIDGFTQSNIPNRAGMPVKNPLYDDLSAGCDKATMAGCAGERDKSLVFLAGIIGVPWQDIAVNPMDLTAGYLTSTQITDMGVWAKILGVPNDPKNPYAPPVPPTDPHMLESITPRAGLAPPNSAANADPINGHEWDPSHDSPPNADLQYACVFPLGMGTKTCTENTDCDCFVPGGSTAGATMNPLCQNGAMYSNVQSRAKGYPGIRELQVLQGLAEQAIVASICPAETTNTNAADYGYRPAIAALISRLRNALRGRCLPRQLAVENGQVPCVIVESFNPPAGGGCDCTTPGRLPIPAGSSVITDEVKAAGTCYCEITQLTDDATSTHPMAGTICQTQQSPPGDEPSGWCYVDPSQTKNMAQCPIVQNCPATDRRIIRFVNPDSEPRGGATAFIMCQEQSFPSSGGAPVDPCPPTP